jgi:predicted Zn-dependent protease
LRLNLAYFALAACLAFNLALPAPPAAAQGVRLPALGEAEGDELSIAAERKIGDQIMREIWPDPDVIDDPVLYEYLQSIFQPLLAAKRRLGEISPEVDEGFAWQPFLVRDRTFNAFALPGGYVGVHLGLIAASGSRDELASVLGHELSHVTQRHIARSMVANKHQSIATTVAMLLGLIAASRSSNPDIPMAVIATGQASIATNQLTYSREMEREADRFGLDAMTEAGFAPAGMAAMFERMDLATRLNDSNQYPWLRSHPLTIERIAEARLRMRNVAPPDPRNSHATEHALMRARARALVDSSETSLRAMQQAARVNAPLSDSDRLGALYGGVMASIQLREFVQADTFLASAQQLLASHAAAASAWNASHPGGTLPSGATASSAAAAGIAAARANTPTFAEMFATPASGAASAPAPGASQSVVVTASAPPVYPIEPIVARDFALLKLQSAVARRSAPDIQAAEAALGDDGSRPVTLARAEAAIGRSVAHDPRAGQALQHETEALQTWVAEHPRDALAWALLAQCAEPLGQKLRAVRAEAESHAAQGDIVGAIDRLHAGQRMARSGGNTDFVEASIIDSRLHELEARRRELAREMGQRE